MAALFIHFCPLPFGGLTPARMVAVVATSFQNFGYCRVAVVEAEDPQAASIGWKPTTISPRAKGVRCVLVDYGRGKVGATTRSGFYRLLAQAAPTAGGGH